MTGRWHRREGVDQTEDAVRSEGVGEHRERGAHAEADRATRFAAPSPSSRAGSRPLGGPDVRDGGGQARIVAIAESGQSTVTVLWPMQVYPRRHRYWVVEAAMAKRAAKEPVTRNSRSARDGHPSVRAVETEVGQTRTFQIAAFGS